MEDCCQYIIGKTIARVQRIKTPKTWTDNTTITFTDDDRTIKVTFTDGSSVFIEASYGSFTGKSEDEYPVHLSVSEIIKN
jgi:hypothetical protein